MMQAHKNKTATLSNTVNNLKARTVSAELNLKRAQAQVNRSTKKLDNVMEYSETLLARIKELEATVKQQQSQIVDLEVNVQEKNKQISELEGHALSRCLGRYARGNVAQHPGLYSFGS